VAIFTLQETNEVRRSYTRSHRPLSVRNRMDRTQQFLNRFNELEQFLREETNSRREAPFGSLIGKAATMNASVRRRERDLREFADLRNAIVHEHPRGHVIADITQEALDEFNGMVDCITQPERVYPLFRTDISVYQEN